MEQATAITEEERLKRGVLTAINLSKQDLDILKLNFAVRLVSENGTQNSITIQTATKLEQETI
jgi:hypothetical protein